MNYQFVKKSANKKVGPIPVTNSHRGTCPPSCPLIGEGGCYADGGYYTRLNWDKLDAGKRGGEWSQLVDQVARLKEGQLWRHNVSGDLPAAEPDKLDVELLADLVTANAGKRGFTYTHYPIEGTNELAIRMANMNGFTINASANTEAQAVDYHKSGLPTVCTISRENRGDRWVSFERGGSRFVQCPAEYREDVSCSTCKLCSVASREVVVGFTVHGSRSANADLIARG